MGHTICLYIPCMARFGILVGDLCEPHATEHQSPAPFPGATWNSKGIISVAQTSRNLKVFAQQSAAVLKDIHFLPWESITLRKRLQSQNPVQRSLPAQNPVSLKTTVFFSSTSQVIAQLDFERLLCCRSQDSLRYEH